MLEIYYDAFQEAQWFRDLHPNLAGARAEPFPPAKTTPAKLQAVLKYDRPDIVLAENGDPILVIERTVEVPSGHNVGQRFARIAASAQNGTPFVYFGPYAAFKHGGETSGPRYMNLRLFKAIDELIRIEKSPVTTVRWPVDDYYEIRRDPAKDERMRHYMDLFFSARASDPKTVLETILNSQFEREQELERQLFVETEVKRADEYALPPSSVVIGSPVALGVSVTSALAVEPQIVRYQVGMRNIRSDPYTGMAILYSYLYCGGLTNRTRPLVLWFPHITKQTWAVSANRGAGTKTIRLFRLASDGICFADGYLDRAQL